MNFDWRIIAALGGAASAVIVVIKLSPDALERISMHAVNVCKEYALAKSSNC